MKPRIYYDSETVCYRATAPNGFCFEESLHELVEPCCPMGSRPSVRDKQESRAAIVKRVAEYGELEKCTVDNCDWCGPKAGAV